MHCHITRTHLLNHFLCFSCLFSINIYAGVTDVSHGYLFSLDFWFEMLSHVGHKVTGGRYRRVDLGFGRNDRRQFIFVSL